MKKLTRILLAIATLTLIGVGAKSCTKTTTSGNNTTQESSRNLQQTEPTYILHTALIDVQQKPTPALLELLNFLQISHENTLDSIVAATQKEWLRAAGKERWQVEEKYADLKKQLIPFFEKTYLLQEIKPLQNSYTYGIILGGTLPRMRSRIAYLKELWKTGLRIEKIVFLTGQRPLDPELEKAESLIDANNGILPFKNDWSTPKELPTMETEMAQLIYQQADLPAELRALPVEFIDAPGKKNPDGTWRRPNTPDTITAWLINNPAPGSCLYISTQPHIGYQNAVIRTYMPKSFTIETVGPAAAAATRNTEILDALARWLYQEKQQLAQSSQIKPELKN